MAEKTGRIKVTWSIDGELVKRVKHEAIDRDTDASGIVEEALRKFLKG
jgi:predicted transcriptional regulator